MTNPLPPTDSPAGIADEQLEELVRLEAEATQGPWTSSREDMDSSACIDGEWVPVAYVYTPDDDHRIQVPGPMFRADSRLIKAMRNAIKPLIARLKRAEAERDENERLIEKEFRPRLDGYSEGLKGKNDRIASIESERDRLREALEPFAEEYRIRRMADSGVDQYALIDMAYANAPGILGSVRAALNNEHFRDAAAALADAGKGGGE